MSFQSPFAGSIPSSSLVRGVGTLQAYTNAGSAAESPPNLTVEFAAIPTCLLSITINGTTKSVAYAADNPGGVDFWIDNAALISATNAATELVNIITGLSISGVTAANAGGTSPVCTVSASAGASYSLAGSVVSGSDVTVAGGGDGEDAVAPSGETAEVVLVAGVAGKKLNIVSFAPGFDGGIAGVTVALYLRSPEDVDTQITASGDAGTCAAWSPMTGAVQYLHEGKDAGESLVAKLTGSLPSDATTCLVAAIAQRLDP